MIGHQGARLRDVGMAARPQIEAMLGTPVYLDLHVKIAKDWQRDPRAAPPPRLLTRRVLVEGVRRPWRAASTTPGGHALTMSRAGRDARSAYGAARPTMLVA